MARSKANPQVLIVRHIMRALCRVTNSMKADGSTLSSKSRRSHLSARDESLNRSYGGLPTDVPKGHCAVYVGSERCRYIIPTKFFSHSLFWALLDKAEEEYGFDHQMGLAIPCDEVSFQYNSFVETWKIQTTAGKIISSTQQSTMYKSKISYSAQEQRILCFGDRTLIWLLKLNERNYYKRKDYNAAWNRSL